MICKKCGHKIRFNYPHGRKSKSVMMHKCSEAGLLLVELEKHRQGRVLAKFFKDKKVKK